MIASHDRQRSKSARSKKLRSPLNLAQKMSLNDQSLQKPSMRMSKGTQLNGLQTSRRPLLKIVDANQANQTINNGKNSTQQFRNRILLTSAQFNKLREKLITRSNTFQNNISHHSKSRGGKKIRIKILQGLSKKTSDSSQKTNTLSSLTGSSGSEQIQQLKVQNQYFKKVYDDTLNELSKLKNKLKEEKKVHEVQRLLYQNQINKLKRIVDPDQEEVSHIFCDQQNRCIIVLSTLGSSDPSSQQLGLESNCQETQSDLSINSR